jgi:lysophospholipase L1-like esterase
MPSVRSGKGTNDINGGTGANAATVWGYVASDTQTLRHCGFKTIVANDPSRLDDDAAEQVYDAYWRGLWQPVSDGFADFGADPNIGGTNAYLNTTYYVGDGVHYTVTGYTLLAQMFAAKQTIFTAVR